LSLSAATWIRPSLNQFEFAQVVPAAAELIPWPVYPLFSLIWVGVLMIFSVYDGRKNIRAVDEFSSLMLGTILAGIASAGFLYLSFRDVSRMLFLVFGAVAFICLTVWRVIYRAALNIRGFEPDRRRVVIVGAGTVGLQASKEFKAHEPFGLKMVGFVDDEVDRPDVIGYIADVREVVRRENINDVVVALPRQAYQRVNQLVADLHDLPIRVWVIPDYFSMVTHKAVIQEVAGIPMLDIRAPALNEYQRMVKRVFDICITLLGLAPGIGLMALVAAAVKLEDGGPVLFRQERVGENGKIFKMLKFRSMVPGAERMQPDNIGEKHIQEVDHKSPDDPRVTRVGRFIRRTSLDELPQLFNVLKGEMSLVGPRPELPALVEKYESWQRKRFSMPPGITGWWQVSGRSEKPMHLNTEDDLYYIQNYSVWMDLVILVKTVSVVLKGKGAY